MIYLDASALLGLLLDEPAAHDVESLLREGDVYITSANYAEVVDQATRVQGKVIAELTHALDPLVAKEILRIASISPAIGLRAGELRSQYYDRRKCPVSLGDCILVGAAGLSQADVATSDQCVADVASAEGLTVRALPNSRGVRPIVS